MTDYCTNQEVMVDYCTDQGGLHIILHEIGHCGICPYYEEEEEE